MYKFYLCRIRWFVLCMKMTNSYVFESNPDCVSRFSIFPVTEPRYLQPSTYPQTQWNQVWWWWWYDISSTLSVRLFVSLWGHITSNNFHTLVWHAGHYIWGGGGLTRLIWDQASWHKQDECRHAPRLHFHLHSNPHLLSSLMYMYLYNMLCSQCKEINQCVWETSPTLCVLFFTSISIHNKNRQRK